MPLSVHLGTDHTTDFERLVAARDGLAEVLARTDDATAADLLVGDAGIVLALPWDDARPPYRFPALPLSEAGLLAACNVALGDYETAHQHLATQPDIAPELLAEIVLVHHVAYGQPVDATMEAVLRVPSDDAAERGRQAHNRAVVLHYTHADREDAEAAYALAAAAIQSPEARAFTAKHYATFLLDGDAAPLAEQVVTKTLAGVTDNVVCDALNETLSQALLAQVAPPYDADLLARLKPLLWAQVERHEAADRPVALAMRLTDAALVAQVEGSFAEAVGYARRAIAAVEYEDVPSVWAQAFMRKGSVLHAWAEAGHPQFYKPASEAYQQALKVFTRDTAPATFAEIHHELGILYAEMPGPKGKRELVQALSVQSFRQALAVFAKETHPYVHARICHNYGSAFLKYPTAHDGWNYERAAHFLREALALRPADHHPTERALTLLNLLEASWHLPGTE
ncbi:MAG: hypothetical protein AAFN13_09820, partial [Bacteroidota bacterium]